jgi:hypothetical protein
MKHRFTRISTRCLVWFSRLVLLHAEGTNAAEPGGGRARREAVTVTTSLVTPFFNALYVEANVRASNKIGVLINASYLTLENNDWKTKTGTVGAGVTYHLQGDALRRWYVEADGELWFSSWRHEPSGEVSSVVLGLGAIAVVGYRVVWELGPVLDLGVGVVGVHLPSARVATSAGPISSDAFTRVYPAVKVNVGWAF